MFTLNSKIVAEKFSCKSKIIGFADPNFHSDFYRSIQLNIP